MSVGGEVPGFGVIAGLAGLGTGAWLHRRGSDGTADSEPESAGGADAKDTGPSGEQPTEQAGERSNDPSEDGG